MKHLIWLRYRGPEWFRRLYFTERSPEEVQAILKAVKLPPGAELKIYSGEQPKPGEPADPGKLLATLRGPEP
jgi:hypothetical protein